VPVTHSPNELELRMNTAPLLWLTWHSELNSWFPTFNHATSLTSQARRILRP
jgi:hypothetical protein